MTKTEKDCINRLADRLETLSSLKKACFSSNRDKDKEVKDAISPYMMWFDIVSELLRDMASDDYWEKNDAMEQIRNYYY